MKGIEIPAIPARAIGSLSESDILSVFVWKNSSGSLSRVSFSRSGSPPKPILSGVVRCDDMTREALGENAVATVAMTRRARKDRIMVDLGFVVLSLLRNELFIYVIVSIHCVLSF